MASFTTFTRLALLITAISVDRGYAQTSVAGCPALITAVGEASGSVTLTLSESIECDEPIVIPAGLTVEITGENSIGPSAAFSSGGQDLGDSLFEVLGTATLTLTGVTIIDSVSREDSESGVRAIYNQGSLDITDCKFDKLNAKGTAVDDGGAIYSDTLGTVAVSGTVFQSNVASMRGGAIAATGSGELTITSCTFRQNEAESDKGGDIWADSSVTLEVTDTTFSGSTSNDGGGSIECCGATITNSNFTETFVSLGDEIQYGGALLVGGPESDACPSKLELRNCFFLAATVESGAGVGGALAIFDTTADIRNCQFQGSEGSAIFFQSSDGDGAHELLMKSVEFYSNINPPEQFMGPQQGQGTALVMQNTAGSDGPSMGSFEEVWCFDNDPYECEFVYDSASPEYSGEIKCRICDVDGNTLAGGDNDLLEGATRDIDSGSDSGSQGIIIGLSLALGLTLVVIGALAVWKFRVRKNARRLMEEMGDGDL